MRRTGKNTHHAKKIAIACGILAGAISFSSSAFAFSDLQGDPAEAKINQLYKEGVINGVTNDKFVPKGKLTFAQGVQIIVSGLKLTPAGAGGSNGASGYFDHVSDQAWYAGAFLTAKQNGLTLDKDVNPNQSISRIQFANLLAQGLKAKGDFPVTLMYFEVTDGEKLSQEQSNHLQMLLNTRIVALENNNTFRPNASITRSEAAAWVHDAAAVAQKAIPPVDSDAQPESDIDANVSVAKAGEGVNKITLTVGNLPNPGYGLSIQSIEFTENKTAVIYFKVTAPDPGKMYPQVISKATAVTYLPEGYSAVPKSAGGYIPPQDSSLLK